MKRNVMRCAVALAVVLSISALAQTGTAATAPAATNPPAATGPQSSKIAIINIEAAIFQSNEGMRDFAALKTRAEPKETEIQKLGKDIEDTQKQLNAQGDKLNDETREKMRRDLELKQKNYQRMVEDYRTEFEPEQNAVAGRILNKMMPVLDKYAKENGYALVLDAGRGSFAQGGPLLWANMPSVDITNQIVDLYNAQSGVPKPAVPAGATARPGATTPVRPGATTPARTTPPPSNTPPKR